MLNLESAQELKQAGLTWVPKLLDYFILPDRNMDDRIFVISDILVTMEMLQNIQIISFQGAPEWALDYLITAEAVWIPREEQLRSALGASLFTSGGDDRITITSSQDRAVCQINFHDQLLKFEADDVGQAYAKALLYVLESKT